MSQPDTIRVGDGNIGLKAYRLMSQTQLRLTLSDDDSINDAPE